MEEGSVIPAETVTEGFAKLLSYPPKNAWNAVVTQLLCWSFRRFCVARLTTDLSGSAADLWDSHFSLIADFAPPQFKDHLNQWLAPENLVHVGALKELDTTFRHLVTVMDGAVSAEDDDIQDDVATLLDEEMGELLEKWLGAVYAPYSIFPNSEESDDNIDMTKLNAVNYLLQRQLTLSRLIKNRRITHRANTIRAATPMKKTRRSKQNSHNVHVRFSPETRGHDARGAGDQNNEREREQREGHEVSVPAQERNTQGEAPLSDKERNHEHPQPPVHAEPVPPPHTLTTDASIQQDNKEEQKERA
jgi:hypothetical protein